MNDKSFLNFMMKPYALLFVGSLLLVAASMRWNADLACYLYPVPFILYVRLGYGRLKLLPVLIAAFMLEVLKIASEPMYAFIAVGAGLQSGLIFWGILLCADWIRTKLGDFFYAPTFALLVAGFEFLGAKFSPLGTWGMMVNSQLDNLNLLQMASITGATGISFLMAWASALIAEFIYNRSKEKSGSPFLIAQAAVLMALFLTANVYGAFRLDSYTEGRQIKTAAVSSKKYTVMDLLQRDKDKAEAARIDNNRNVWGKIVSAGELKSELIVTNEGALFLNPEEEESMFAKAKETAKKYNADLVIGYILFRGEGKKFFNKSVWIKKDGTIAQVYYKQFVPPGEPSEHITQKIEPITNDGYIAGMAICYDFDSLNITSAHGHSGAGIVAIPSSDWRGIDPIHTQMTRLRAIEQGYSVIRSTRAAVSAVYDNRGRSRGELPWYEENDGILLSTVPAVHEPTFYSRMGDWFGWGSLLAAGILIFWSLRSAIKRQE